jgi:hypothetical protein
LEIKLTPSRDGIKTVFCIFGTVSTTCLVSLTVKNVSYRHNILGVLYTLAWHKNIIEVYEMCEINGIEKSAKKNTKYDFSPRGKHHKRVQ